MMREIATVLCAAALTIVVTGARANSSEHERNGMPVRFVHCNTLDDQFVEAGSLPDGVDPNVVWSINVFLPVPE